MSFVCTGSNLLSVTTRPSKPSALCLLIPLRQQPHSAFETSSETADGVHRCCRWSPPLAFLMPTAAAKLCQTLVPAFTDEVVKEVYGGDKDEPREGVVAIQGGGLPLDAGDHITSACMSLCNVLLAFTVLHVICRNTQHPARSVKVFLNLARCVAHHTSSKCYKDCDCTSGLLTSSRCVAWRACRCSHELQLC